MARVQLQLQVFHNITAEAFVQSELVNCDQLHALKWFLVRTLDYLHEYMM